MNKVYLIQIFEYEQGRGTRWDDDVYCKTLEAAHKFIEKFNYEYNDYDNMYWRMWAKLCKSQIELSDDEMQLFPSDTIWRSNLDRELEIINDLIEKIV